MNGEAAKGGDSDTSFFLGLAYVKRSTNGMSSIEVSAWLESPFCRKSLKKPFLSRAKHQEEIDC